MKLYTFSHNISFLKRMMNNSENSMQYEIVETNVEKLKIGYSIYEFIHALCDNIKNTDGMFYTCVVACGRRILHPILKHKALKEYNIDEMINLMSGRRVRIYHISKYKNCNIKFGYMKLRALSNLEKAELKNILQINDISALIEPMCWKFIDSVGGSLYPNSVLNLRANMI